MFNLPVLKPYVLSSNTGNAQAPLTFDGPIFVLEGQPWRYKAVSAFKLCRLHADGVDIDPFLRDYDGFNVLRVWDYVTWSGTGWESCTPEQWVAFIRYVGSKGWRVEITLVTDDVSSRIGYAKFLAHALASEGLTNVLFEGGNEPTTHKNINTAALRQTLESSGLPYTSGDYEDSDRWYGNYYTCHTARTSDWPRRSHDLYEFYTGAGPDKPTHPHHVPCLGDEPGKLQDVGAVPADWLAYFGACSIMGGGACFHSETGKYAARPTNLELELSRIALEGLNAFPTDAAKGSYRRIVEPGQLPDARTYVVGNCMVRSQQVGLSAPEPGWQPLDSYGVLFTR